MVSNQPTSDTRDGRPARLSRRNILLGSAAMGVGGIASAGAAVLTKPPEARGSQDLNGTKVIAFHGAHQAGIAITPQSHSSFFSLDLKPGTGREELIRLMQLLSGDAARLTRGEPALADSEPELGQIPARLTVTFGFGPGFVDAAGGRKPDWLRPLPAFGIDRLTGDYDHGDLLIEVAADDPIAVAHTARMLLKDSRRFTALRWVQTGFRRAHGSVKPGTTMRNLFGQVDGTVNPQPGTAEFDELVWSSDSWLAGGTSMVIRRISMDLDKWDHLDRPGREQSVGRKLSNGAPLTGAQEADEPDFKALSPVGFPVIPEFSHIRRARSENPKEKIVRRAFNYDDPPSGSRISNAGLIFTSFQADVDKQFIPLQKRLDKLDLLNEWTTPVGSAVFAIPPGCKEGGYIGETLLEANRAS
ncbi:MULTISPECIES: Dyp-type peroxidase [Micrococcaceae]|uniref:Dyp-type peroxidase n=1 Tax=Micrococcaceae TaxID=1268 RepID=UPI000BB7ABEF|nr:Dyp-type peroxidase [Glutamicibacter sp. BW78]MDN5755568.1 Dyp-type peroxidase [Micrococcaceae bacterium]MDN5880507.1 Dyp-type peroxidase [Micrococcaceae bacterium]PCC26320.1 peroxidase [Glutamicibacter sp. BW78]